MRNWILPEYIEDILPAEALAIEVIRRRILDRLLVCGYQLVMPPMLEFVESLIPSNDSNMNLRMFKVIDQLSGKMMGLRADITSQIARIDAHLLNHAGVTRLCYVGSVLHTTPSGLNRTRELLQIGAELYGHAGLESDLEIQKLMLQCLIISGINEIYLDLGHVAVFRGLINGEKIPVELETELFGALQAKDTSTLKELCVGAKKYMGKVSQQAFMLLPELYGDRRILIQARKLLPDYPEIRMALDELGTVATELESSVRALNFDLADLRGYHYHTGIVFAAYTNNSPNAVALGGRYDEIGKAFGRARPATGFSMDLRELSRLIKLDSRPKAILAPYNRNNKNLNKKIEHLRNEGEIVVVELSKYQNKKNTFGCNRKLVLKNKVWEVIDI
ncbi:MAG: ATP phosphoribosyltransferase regulatory subunit [Nitrosospira sp.]|nr:ATP phosphoribosyltransferase regulatory subunit [Nitrosospira sp.]MBI0408124.1 ATP phosphoribosyltransferase regulatory subunit [Nitrosospira sp.]MBI0417052.1 ATP phosphoribosyltransferase regulatory subunit [Nitrosospira sp.]MBI0418420.1 ATP phosphoribosyltransferase regulatory subunit [Nitrosospira sp.]MBI0419198.1 ATP phosphoribosyltransferase regulatory subunit [Nitrosospira sp.]